MHKADNPTTTRVSDGMVHAALETEYEGTTLRSLLNAQLWYYGAYGNAKAMVRRALDNALKEQAAVGASAPDEEARK